jgi:glycerol kinase
VVAPLLIGIDEGTTAVKAALFEVRLTPGSKNERLEPLREARRRKRSTHPRPGWVEQDPVEILDAVVDAVAELLAGARGEVVGCGLDHQGESVLAWDGDTGEPLSPVIVWQDKRQTELLTELDEDAIRARSGLPLDPYFSAGKYAWLLRHGVAVTPSLRLGNVDAWLTDRLGAGYATDASTASRTQLHRLGDPGWDPWLCEAFGVPADALPPVGDSVGALGMLRHERWPVELPLTARVVDQQAALAGAGCVSPGLVKATYGTGVFVLAHVGDEVPKAAGGLLPTAAWRIGGRTEYALDGGVFAAGEMLEWLCRELGLAAEPAALGELARGVESSDGVRILPGITGVGAPWWRPDARGTIAGLTAGTKRAQVAHAALEGIAWRVADVVAAVRETVSVETLRVDGGLTNEPALLQLQADAIGVPVERGLADATAAGSAALAAVGAGLLPSVADIAGLVPTTDRVEPGRDAAWREREHAAWRRFVKLAVEL